MSTGDLLQLWPKQHRAIAHTYAQRTNPSQSRAKRTIFGSNPEFSVQSNAAQVHLIKRQKAKMHAAESTGSIVDPRRCTVR